MKVLNYGPKWSTSTLSKPAMPGCLLVTSTQHRQKSLNKLLYSRKHLGLVVENLWANLPGLRCKPRKTELQESTSANCFAKNLRRRVFMEAEERAWQLLWILKRVLFPYVLQNDHLNQISGWNSMCCRLTHFADISKTKTIPIAMTSIWTCRSGPSSTSSTCKLSVYCSDFFLWWHPLQFVTHDSATIPA
jgi:hypothetical protein